MKKLYYTSNILLLLVLVLLGSCKKSESTETKEKAKPKKTIEHTKPKTTSYHFEKTKEWLKANGSDSTKLHIAYALNRTDKANFAKMDSASSQLSKKLNLKFEI